MMIRCINGIYPISLDWSEDHDLPLSSLSYYIPFQCHLMQPVYLLWSGKCTLGVLRPGDCVPVCQKLGNGQKRQFKALSMPVLNKTVLYHETTEQPALVFPINCRVPTHHSHLTSGVACGKFSRKPRQPGLIHQVTFNTYYGKVTKLAFPLPPQENNTDFVLKNIN